MPQEHITREDQVTSEAIGHTHMKIGNEAIEARQRSEAI